MPLPVGQTSREYVPHRNHHVTLSLGEGGSPRLDLQRLLSSGESQLEDALSQFTTIQMEMQMFRLRPSALDFSIPTSQPSGREICRTISIFSNTRQPVTRGGHTQVDASSFKRNPGHFNVRQPWPPMSHPHIPPTTGPGLKWLAAAALFYFPGARKDGFRLWTGSDHPLILQVLGTRSASSRWGNTTSQHFYIARQPPPDPGPCLRRRCGWPPVQAAKAV
ncbi:hypothetical protein B0T21DRAFT_349034 [Apiosordaria backusii]|uniref:Uncharacterized protein n=1 Tax=Apiosordaria backusii TaxID=314023 RepID=A0AA40EH67_9PEZI|nr:hypothetical protein B0T21DRAFT_349034 [Apiosordaria backusii]